jgi:trimethylamine--corrinoid protein Co-methyltransferase
VGDAQSGHEKTLTALMGVLAGAGCIFGAGMLDTGVAFDPAVLVMDNEWAEMIMQVSRGIVVNDETLMVDEIHKVGPHGDFLSLDSTLKHMREQSQPQLMERRGREEWEADGATDLYTRCLAKARQLLKTHVVEPLDPDVVAQMRAFVRACDAEKGVTYAGD